MTTFTRSDGGKAEDSWEAHKDAIYQLYISEKGKLQGPDGVISKMRLMYNFDKRS
jgi:hypothetical protein